MASTIRNEPILKPYLNGTFRHVDFLGDSFPNRASGCRILVELDLQRNELLLGGALPFLILLLLGQGAFPWRATRRRGSGPLTRVGRGSRGRGRGRHVVAHIGGGLHAHRRFNFQPTDGSNDRLISNCAEHAANLVELGSNVIYSSRISSAG